MGPLKYRTFTTYLVLSAAPLADLVGPKDRTLRASVRAHRSTQQPRGEEPTGSDRELRPSDDRNQRSASPSASPQTDPRGLVMIVLRVGHFQRVLRILRFDSTSGRNWLGAACGSLASE